MREDAAISQKALQFLKSTMRRGSLCLSPADHVRGGHVENINANSDQVETPIQLKRHYEQSEAIQGECHANPPT